MAENKKSVIIYCDWGAVFDGLEDDEAGKLIKHFFNYVRDLNPVAPDKLTSIAFEPIKQQLKRDLVKWDNIRDKRSLAGLASANKRKHVSTSVESVEQTSTNPTVNVNDTVNVNVTVKNNNIEERKLKFASTLEIHLQVYGRDMLNDFYKYWTEPNKSNTKFRQELEKTWSLDRRLETWAKNNNKFKTNGESKKDKRQANNDALDQLTEAAKRQLNGSVNP